MYKVLITGALHSSAIESLQQEPDLEIDYCPDLPKDEILNRIHQYECIVTRSETSIQKELIDRATNLKVIARAAVGIANIDVDYATEKGILVIHTPGKNTNSAAELTLSLLLAAIRNVVPAHLNMQNGGWDRHRYTGTELLHKTIGIIGLGNVGHRVAQFCRAFDMQVLAYDPYISDEVFDRHGAQKSSLEEICEKADIVTLHTPKNKETIGIIGAEQIASMKEGVVIINAARGGIIDEAALLEGLRSNKVKAAGIDTWETEPPPDNPFAGMPNVVMTPHIGASTLEAQVRIGASVASQVPRALRGEVVDFPVNMPRVQILEGDLVSSYTTLAEKLGVFASQYLLFSPSHLELKYRGTLAKQNVALLRLCFLKGLLGRKHESVSFVNAEQIAESTGLRIEEEKDLHFTDYENALKCTLSSRDQTFTIGGVVFSGPHPRLTLVNGFVLEMEPTGTILAIKNNDQPGMVGALGACLGENGVNIDQFSLGRDKRGGEAMALIRVDNDLPDTLIEQLQNLSGINFARKIVL
jgi:D-3-phosphoglycerate dehydrogenase